MPSIETMPAAVAIATTEPPDELSELRSRVNAFLEARNLPSHDSPAMYAKSAIIISLWCLAYAVFAFGGLLHFGFALIGAVVLSFFTLCMEMAVMHDASHNGVSRHRWINRLLDVTLIVIGACPIIWYYKHVKAHHFNTNVPGHDHDIEAGSLFRFHREAKWHPWHRFQHLYALTLYAGLAFKWILFDDVYDGAINAYGVPKNQRRVMWTQIIVSKICHFTLFLIVPWFVLKSIPLVLAIYAVHWMLLSVGLATTFQLAHVTGLQGFPSFDEKQKNNWIRHQLATTTDFAVSNRLLGWVVGGLNMQVEHHIFPRLPHVHYRIIQPIVAQFCAEKDIRYLEYPTIRAALADHFQHLRNLGRKPQVP